MKPDKNEIKKMCESDNIIKTKTTKDKSVGMSEHEDAIAAVVCNLFDITIAKVDGAWCVHWESSDKSKVKECALRCFVLDVLLHNHNGICKEHDIYFLACLTGWVNKFESGDMIGIVYLPSADQYFIDS